jgi:hypothetical protein
MAANKIVNTTDNGLNIGGYAGPRLVTTHEFRLYFAAVASAPYTKEFHVNILANNFEPRFFMYQMINLIPMNQLQRYCELLSFKYISGCGLTEYKIVTRLRSHPTFHAFLSLLNITPIIADWNPPNKHVAMEDQYLYG